MRRDVQEIFRQTPHEKQVMMFSATLSKETREICKKFMQDVNIHKTFPLSQHSNLIKDIGFNNKNFVAPCKYPNFRAKG